VAKAYLELSEAETRLTEVRKGEKAGKAWVAAVSQNFALGLADARDFSDALLQSFKMRTFALQAVYDLNISTATLSRATGTSVP
jgi:outer membrane protein TolC